MEKEEEKEEEDEEEEEEEKEAEEEEEEEEEEGEEEAVMYVQCMHVPYRCACVLSTPQELGPVVTRITRRAQSWQARTGLAGLPSRGERESTSLILSEQRK